jgi:hypothetical protein
VQKAIVDLLVDPSVTGPREASRFTTLRYVAGYIRSVDGSLQVACAGGSLSGRETPASRGLVSFWARGVNYLNVASE